MSTQRWTEADRMLLSFGLLPAVLALAAVAPCEKPGLTPNGTYFRLFSHGVAAAGSPRRKPWDVFASQPLAPDGAAARFAPFFCTQNLSPPPGLRIINDSYPHGLRHGLLAVTPAGVKVSAIRLTPNG